MKVFAIAYNTFKEAVRNRVLYVLLFFALIMLLGSWVISTLAIFGQERFVRDFGIFGINIVSVAIAVFVGINLVYNDLDKKTIYTIISKPISRWQFLIGKYFGLLLTIFVNVLIMTFFFLSLLYFRDYTSDETISKLFEGAAPSGISLLFFYITSIIKSLFFGFISVISLGFYSTDVTFGIVQSSMLTMLEMAVITSFAILFSSFTSPTLSAFLTVIVFLIGRANQSLYLFADLAVRQAGGIENLSGGQLVGYYFSLGAAHVAPNLDVFNQMEQIARFEPVEITAYSIIYGAAYASMVLVIATMIFNRRNFK